MAPELGSKREKIRAETKNSKISRVERITGNVSKLKPSELSKVRNLKNYNAFREAQGDFTSDLRNL